MAEHVLIAGASGVVGYAALKHYAAQAGVAVTAVSRRPPLETFQARRLAVDLADAAAARAALGEPGGVTRLVYAALHEKPGLIAGWREADQIDTNRRMLANTLSALEATSPELAHVTLLQGTKAYGAHVHAIPLPAREDRDEDRGVENFYWEQEALLRAEAERRGFAWTILRPQIIFGEALGAAMNLIPAIGAYAALLKADGEPLHFPGGGDTILEAVDADLLARVIDWAGRTPAARNQAFNVTNGDVFTWRGVWPAIAAALGMAVGEDRPMSLAQAMAGRAGDWDALRRAHGLAAPGLDAFVGQGFHYADFTMGYGRPAAAGTLAGAALVSTVKLRQAGFCEAVDTEAMFRRFFRLFQEARLLPAPSGAR
jgi:nucleoside-diphosphate-sugar epimerase